jgi:hypothetical protein
MDIDDAVEEAMEKIRESDFLTDAVSRTESLKFLTQLMGRLGDLYEELAHETLKHGDG